MVSGALGKITDFHTFTSSFSNCAMRCVCVAPCCEYIAAAPKKNAMSIAARLQAVFIVSSGRASYHADCERRSLLSLRHPRTVGTPFHAHPPLARVAVNPTHEECIHRPGRSSRAFLRPFTRE